MAEYYEKLIDLQNKLRRSEEERLKLEIKFSEIIQVTREEEQLHYRKLRHQYKIFLEEDRKRQERNEKILRTLEKIDTRIGRLASKSEVYQRPRRLCRNCHQSCATPKYPSRTDDITKPEKSVTNLPNYEQKYPKEATSKLDIIDEYLNSLKKTPKSSAKQNQFERISTTELDHLAEGLNKKFDSNQANSIAAEIMNSIYSRHYENVFPFKADNTNLSSSVSSKEISVIVPKDRSYSAETSSKNSPNPSSIVPDNRKEEIIEEIRRRVEKSDESNLHDKEDESKIAQELNCLAKENYSKIIGNAPDLIVEPVEEQPPEKLTKNKQKVTEAQKLRDTLLPTRTNNNKQFERPGDEQIQEDEVPAVPPCTSMGDDQRDQYDIHGKVIDYGPDNNQLMNQHAQNHENGLIIAQQQQEDTGENINQYENGQNIQQQYEETGENIQQIIEQHDNLDENRKHIDQYAPQYDENGQIIQQQHEDTGENIDQYEPQYDENGQIIQQQYEGTGENINQYESRYDENRHIIQQQNFDENDKHIEQYEPQYDENGKIIQQHYDEIGHHINQYEPHQYDENRQIIDENSKHIDQHEPQYDENGQIIQKQYEGTGENINQYESRYDENGHIIQQQNFDENDKHIEQYEPQYDENGKIIQKQYEGTSENINKYEPEYDVNGQIIQQQNFEDGVGTHIDQYEPQYDENGQIIQKQYEDISHNINQYEPKYDENEYEHQYDANGQFIGQQYEETGQNIYQYEPQYDESGQIIQQQNFDETNSDNIQPHYDENEPVTQQYDENGQPIQPYDQQDDEYGQSESRQITHDPKKDDRDNGFQNKVMDMLDTDTDSLKQNTSKISNESDFDFGSG